MNKRLIWNFELTNLSPVVWTELSEGKSELRWEARFFWSEEQIISLNTLPADCLNLSNFKFKNHHDTYYLVPNFEGNIKLRNGLLVYKPLVKSQFNISGFAKKIDIPNNGTSIELMHNDSLLVLDPQSFTSENTPVTVKKEAAVWKLATEPAVKVELSRLTLADAVFWSACIEGRSFSHVQHLSQLIFPSAHPENYVQFLKKINHVP